MLDKIVDLLNLFTSTITTIIHISYIIGKCLTWLLSSIGHLIYTVCSATCNFLVVFYEDFTLFCKELYTSLGTVATTVNDSIDSSLRLSTAFVNHVLEAFTHGIQKSHFQVVSITTLVQNALGAVLRFAKHLVILAGEGCWFLLTLLPRFLLFLAVCLKAGLLEIAASVTRIWAVFSRKCVLAAITAWEFFVDVPLHCLLGLGLMYLLYKRRRWARYWLVRVWRALVEAYEHYSHLMRLRHIRSMRGRRPIMRDMSPRPPLDAPVGPTPRKPLNSVETEQVPGGGSPPVGACVVCLDRVKSVVLLPCKHLCLCWPCSEELERYQSHCPLCRKQVARMINVYT